ncbi:hypothetical protein SAMN05421594_2442 [Chryseobacterium oleae]|uniref:Uncharacterized protein n=1 Tax=Chryseobacterium oleae TaxID=491207 RepID=A0A1I4YID9_CHROL|nr:hypothetical protein [Chryseobacterium oleae]SFN37775.1 hypothetical protein SAMN05421594_2442 [Chryseobacterium oleae]
MHFDFMIINIGEFIRLKVIELEVEMDTICAFFQCSEEEIEEMYKSKSINISNLQKWNKLLDNDFFSNLCLASYSSCTTDVQSDHP